MRDERGRQPRSYVSVVRRPGDGQPDPSVLAEAEVIDRHGHGRAPACRAPVHPRPARQAWRALPRRAQPGEPAKLRIKHVPHIHPHDY